MSNTVLEVSDLSVAIQGGDRTHAVRGINLTVGADEIVCVVDESGSGKSVTAQAVMGLLPKGAMQVESGSIRLQGDQLLTKSDAELRAVRPAYDQGLSRLIDAIRWPVRRNQGG